MPVAGIFERIQGLFSSAPEFPEFLAEWDDLLDDQMMHWDQLTDDEQERLETLTLHYMNEWRWEAQHGFELTTEMIVLIAASASVLVLELDFDAYRGMKSVVVGETTMVLDQERAGPGGLVTAGPVAALGHTSPRGPVFLAWDAVQSGAGRSGQGFNVTYHEFAHRLDFSDGIVDGTPILESEADYPKWIEASTKLYEAVRNGMGPRLLRDYAGTNPAEFFAVATEVFFDKGAAMERELPDLYAVMLSYYGQDTAERDRRVRRAQKRKRDSSAKRRKMPVRGASGKRRR